MAFRILRHCDIQFCFLDSKFKYHLTDLLSILFRVEKASTNQILQSIQLTTPVLQLLRFGLGHLHFYHNTPAMSLSLSCNIRIENIVYIPNSI